MPEQAEVLVVGKMPAAVISELVQDFIVHHTDLTASNRRPGFSPARIRLIVASGSSPLNGDFIARFPMLEQISIHGVGYEGVDTQFLKSKGIVLTNTPDVSTEEVADTALGLLLCAVRQLPQADRYVRSGRWLDGPMAPGQSLRDRRVGLVGLGRIGRGIARRLDAMRVPVAYHARSRRTDAPYPYYESLLELAREVDVLMLALTGGEQSRMLINASILKALGRRGILINVSRGSVVDEDALISALEAGEILTAGLDVFADEPNVPERLLAMDRVVLLPHLGSSSEVTRGAMIQLLLQNIRAWADRRPVVSAVA